MAATAQRAAELLVTPQTRLPLTATEAAHVVAQMGVVQFPPGATLIHEGDDQRTGHMLLLEGEVQVDTGEVPISVLGTGDALCGRCEPSVRTLNVRTRKNRRGRCAQSREKTTCTPRSGQRQPARHSPP